MIQCEAKKLQKEVKQDIILVHKTRGCSEMAITAVSKTAFHSSSLCAPAKGAIIEYAITLPIF